MAINTLAYSGKIRYQEAADLYRRALSLRPGLPAACIGLGYALEQLGRYSEATESYCRADAGQPKAALAYHLGGYLQWTHGSYSAAWANWSKALGEYASQYDSIRGSNDIEQLNAYAHLLHEVFMNLPAAEKVYKEARDLQNDHIGVVTGLVTLYRDLHDASDQVGREIALAGAWPDNSSAYWLARDAYEEAQEILSERLATRSDESMLVELGLIALSMGRFEDAEAYLERGLSAGASRLRSLMGLGILCMRQADYLKAIQYLSRAMREDEDDLTVHCLLGQAYLGAQLVDQAQTEYDLVLARAPGNIDALIGMGSAQTALGDAGDRDSYDDSIDTLTRAINLHDSNRGSRRLTRRELSAVQYSCGYARVKLYQAAIVPRRTLVAEALKDFSNARANDASNRRAKRAVDVVGKASASLPSRFGDAAAGWLVVACAIAVFILATSSMFVGWPAPALRANLGSTIIIFGSLLFVIAGLHLPQLLKIRVAGVELEKSVPDVASLGAALVGITREGRVFIGGFISRPSEVAERHSERTASVKAAAAEPVSETTMAEAD